MLYKTIEILSDGHEYGIEAIGSLNGAKRMAFAQMRVDLMVWRRREWS